MATTIVLVDEQRLVREGLRRILEQREDLKVVGEAPHVSKLPRWVSETLPDIALIELPVRCESVLETIRLINGGPTKTRCIGLSNHRSRIYVEEVLRAGASGLVLKDDTPDEFLSAIDAVRSGNLYISPSITLDEISRSGGALSGRVPSLTPREREVLVLIAEGMSSKEIAVELGVSPKTADSHRSRLMEKTGIHKVSRLVRFAIREGLVSS